MKTEVYVVFAVDCCWHGYSGLRAAGFFSNEAYSLGNADEKEVIRDIEITLELSDRALGGKLSWAPHSSPAHRYFLYSDPFFDYWREVERQGGEISVHPHEDIPGERSRIRETGHMRIVIEDLLNVLTQAGCAPKSFRPGYFGRNDELAGVLEELDLLVDYSAAPGRHDDFVGCDWRGAPLSGGFLSHGSAAEFGSPGKDRSKVFEIPLAWDGKGDKFEENYLFNELSTLEKLKTVFSTLQQRTRSEGAPQFVHFLFHSSAMTKSLFREQVADLAGHILENEGKLVTGAEARKIYLGGPASS